MIDDLIERFQTLPGAARLLTALGPGDEAYLVGGTVRDLWRGADPVDLDVVVVGDVDGLAGRLGDPVRAHERFGTATLRAPGAVRYDLARARRERYPRPGALPEVEPAGIEEDLARRDFSVNALALGLSGPGIGRLRCAAHGVEDMAAHRLRVLHDASFRDDPTRLLRLARYTARLGFEIEPGTEALARAAVGAGALETVSGPRIGAELELLAGEADPVAGFERMRELGIDAALLPGLGIEDPALARRALALAPADADRVALLLGAAGRGIEPAALRLWLDGLGLPAAPRNVALAAAAADGLAATLAAASSPAQIAAAVADAPPEAVALAGALGAEAQARAWLVRLRDVTLDIDGDDLIAAGMRAGPELGAALRAALRAKLDGQAPTRDAQLAEALRSARLGDEH